MEMLSVVRSSIAISPGDWVGDVEPTTGMETDGRLQVWKLLECVDNESLKVQGMTHMDIRSFQEQAVQVPDIGSSSQKFFVWIEVRGRDSGQSIMGLILLRSPEPSAAFSLGIYWAEPTFKATPVADFGCCHTIIAKTVRGN